MTDVSTATDKKVDRVATHEYLDAKGNVVDAEEDARGIRHTLHGASKPFEWNWDEANEAERLMLAIFGAKTLSTNEASGIRNNKAIKGTDKASPDIQLNAIVDRFGRVRLGEWIDRTRGEGAAVVIDLDKLAEAICQVQVKLGKKTQAECDSGYHAAVRQRLEDNTDNYRTKTRKVPEVAAAYSTLMGKPVTADALDF